MMGEGTKIEWADHTFNPWIGCTKISPACDNCYAEAFDQRFSQGEHWGARAPRKRTSIANWRKPIQWDKQAQKDGVRRKVFCASLADVFDNHSSITSGWRGDLWSLIERTPNLDWLLLTKRPQNISKMLPESYGMPEWGDGWSNVWLGTTVENQKQADQNIPRLLSVPAKLHFVSVEPLLGAVSMSKYLHESDCDLAPDEFTELCLCAFRQVTGDQFQERKINWVIAGGESGPNARASNPEWFRDLRDQCAGANVPFFFKQWGEFAPVKGNQIERVGKVAAGRLLDGVEHSAFPWEEGGAR